MQQSESRSGNTEAAFVIDSIAYQSSGLQLDLDRIVRRDGADNRVEELLHL